MADRGRASRPDRLLASVLRPLLGVMVHRSLLRQPRRTRDGRAIVGGPYPIRVLVIGAGMVVGFDARGGSPSLPRQLADALALRTGRGAVVESRVQAPVRLERTIDAIGMAGAAAFDVVVWSPTLEEVFRGGSRRWRKQLRSIVEHLRATGRPDVRIILMGVPEMEGDRLLERCGSVLARSVDLGIQAVAAMFERVEHLPVPPRPIGAADTPLLAPEGRAGVVAAVAALIDLRFRSGATSVRTPQADGGAARPERARLRRRRRAGAPSRSDRE